MNVYGKPIAPTWASTPSLLTRSGVQNTCDDGAVCL